MSLPRSRARGVCSISSKLSLPIVPHYQFSAPEESSDRCLDRSQSFKLNPNLCRLYRGTYPVCFGFNPFSNRDRIARAAHSSVNTRDLRYGLGEICAFQTVTGNATTGARYELGPSQCLQNESLSVPYLAMPNSERPSDLGGGETAAPKD